MFDGLFCDEDVFSNSGDKPVSSKTPSVPKPAPRRGSTGLSGLSNLGATCYLNSLLQTLHYTPEFREFLFHLDESDLGVLSKGKDSDNSMVRVIPIQLQRLFARLLLLNQHSADVTALTDSFGWTNNEEFQQHDVQELNRILFSAIESSLLGTSGEHLIAKLYHGATVQQITCLACGRVSEREEEFLDIPVALSGHTGLEDTLREAFINLESLDGSNQYRCGSCQKLVDAKRGCHIRKLPPILTFALLRFLYDFKKGERYKDTSKFKFPLTLDMTPYCEHNSVKADGIYELFSVVIHSGSTHSGHYTAYIRDVDDLGHWTHPNDEPVHLAPDPASGDVDLMDYENPADLLVALMQQLGGRASLSKLCKSLQDQTGVTWNKRFKKQFGPIVKFMESCVGLFTFTEPNSVSLNQPKKNQVHDQNRTPPTPLVSHTLQPLQTGDAAGKGTPFDVGVSTSSVADDGGGEEMMCGSSGGGVDSLSGGVVPSLNAEGDVDVGGGASNKISRWFEFNDVHVSPILSQSIERMYQGKQSAYMLFYRKKSLRRPEEARECPSFGVPSHLVSEVITENGKIEDERVSYDIFINTIRMNLHFHSQWYYSNGALHKTMDSELLCIEIDKRKTVKDMKDLIAESYPGLLSTGADGDVVIHTAKCLPAGMHLYDVISDKDGATLAALDIGNESHFFIWNGVKVRGEAVQVGESCEPIQLHVTYPTARDGESRHTKNNGRRGEEGQAEVVMGLSKNSTLGELRVTLSDLLGALPNQVTLSQVKVQERRGQTQSSVVILSSAKDKYSLSHLELSDGDKLAAERDIKKGTKTLAHSVADKQNKLLSFIIEDRYSPVSPSGSYTVFPVELGRDELVSTLRSTVISMKNIDGNVRFRTETKISELGPLLYEHQTLSEAEISQGQRVVMEGGSPPLHSQIALQCRLSASIAQKVGEVVVEKTMSVGECCGVMVMALGLNGNLWHLRKTNWCGEEDNIMEDETATLEDEKLKSGSLLIVEAGRLPPKGFVRLSIFLHSPNSPIVPQRPSMLSEATPTSVGWEPTSSERYPTTSSAASGSGGGDITAEGIESDSASTTMEASGGDIPLHLIPPSNYYPPLHGDLIEVGAVEVDKSSTLDDLKMHILTLPLFENYVFPTYGFLRARELVKGRPGRIFKQGSSSLKRLKLNSNSQICCQVLDNEEELPASVVVFNVAMRNDADRSYGPFIEVKYDMELGIKASSPHALRVHLSQMLDVPLDHLVIAKHKIEMFQWIIIDSIQTNSKRGGGRKGSGSAGSKANIKTSPIMLRDGDTVGYKDMRFCDETNTDFSTPDDDSGKAILLAIQEDKRKRRKAKEETDILGPKEKRQRRPERGIKIYVPDYRSKAL